MHLICVQISKKLMVVQCYVIITILITSKKTANIYTFAEIYFLWD